MAEPSLYFKLTGSGEITELDNKYTWSQTKKLERTFYIKDADGAQALDLTEFESIELIMVTSSEKFTVSIDSLNTKDSGDSAGYTGSYLLRCQRLFTWFPSEDEDVTGLSISTYSTNDTSIQVRIYGS